MNAYIKGISIVSPQKIIGDQILPNDAPAHPDLGYMKCIEPAYREFIDPMVARRMSRIVKMGVYCARKCMNDTGINMPDGIIAGTALGCLEDTEKFLSSIYTSEEKLLNPTPFIQSTHNTVAGAIALAVKCHGYNATYTQRGFSFENALQDALMQLHEDPSKNILVGGFDEVTDTSLAITSRLGLWKNHPVEKDRLYEYKTRGSLAGEGAAFLMLNGKQKYTDEVSIKSLTCFYDGHVNDINRKIAECLDREGILSQKIDLVILGNNGDVRYDQYYHKLVSGIFNKSAVTGFKHLCGEYDTSASFAVWLAWYIMKHKKLNLLSLNDIPVPGEVNSVLIYNNLRGKYHSVYYLEKC
ncbi:MAG TPA: beta-ketoacyl synthase chain length factor [Bacteroidales bacterium]|jgi:hypothetical protein|nr:beta-ketoacyl synthase chain length factor [Bacteroidales bacterium]